MAEYSKRRNLENGLVALKKVEELKGRFVLAHNLADEVSLVPQTKNGGFLAGVPSHPTADTVILLHEKGALKFSFKMSTNEGNKTFGPNLVAETVVNLNLEKGIEILEEELESMPEITDSGAVG